jgi:hypothetical protein
MGFFDADPGSEMEKLGSGMEKNRIRDQYPGSAALDITFLFSHELQKIPRKAKAARRRSGPF